MNEGPNAGSILRASSPVIEFHHNAVMLYKPTRALSRRYPFSVSYTLNAPWRCSSDAQAPSRSNIRHEIVIDARVDRGEWREILSNSPAASGFASCTSQGMSLGGMGEDVPATGPSGSSIQPNARPKSGRQLGTTSVTAIRRRFPNEALSPWGSR